MELGNAYLASCELPDRLGRSRPARGRARRVRLARRAGRRRGALRRTRQPAAARCRSPSASATCCPPNAARPARCSRRWTARDWEAGGSAGAATRWAPAFPPFRRAADGAGADPHGRFEQRVAAARAAGLVAGRPAHRAGPDRRRAARARRVGHGGLRGQRRQPHQPASARSLAGHALPRLHATRAAMEAPLRAPARRRAAAPPPAGPGPQGDPERASKQELGPASSSRWPGGSPCSPRSAPAAAALTADGRGPRPPASPRHRAPCPDHPGTPRLRRAPTAGLSRLTPQVLELGFARSPAWPSARSLSPHLVALVERVHDSASIAVLPATTSSMWPASPPPAS